MTECISFAVGFICALIFVFWKLPVPITPTLSGFMGLVGLFVGHVVGTKFL